VKILVTGGNTYVPIDKVRGITNIFKGRTACDIALEATDRGHEVTVIGNRHMESVYQTLSCDSRKLAVEWGFYKTYDGLYNHMQDLISHRDFEVVIHSAAVSDYKVNRVLEPAMLDLSPSSVPMGGKISSSYDRLYLELTPTEKIVDQIRSEWGFHGVLVKFKLEVDKTDEELLDIAEKSRRHSEADIMVANCLEWARERAFVMTDGDIKGVNRKDLATTLLTVVENAYRQQPTNH
jgi:phosphopantothenate-cysteine ligase/phosphopantothenoylcysteine decarboxylase/phosphopantothenate--cysteine ligase